MASKSSFIQVWRGNGSEGIVQEFTSKKSSWLKVAQGESRWLKAF
jgi:hypothetical protein